MSPLLHRSRRVLACLAVLTPLAAASAARADQGAPALEPRVMQAAATTYSTPHNPCGRRVIEHPFTQWDDLADYFLVEQGDMSANADQWDVGTGEIAAEDNQYTLHADVPASLSLSEGDTATAPMVCVGIDTPTMRFFVKNNGAETGTLKVSVIYEDDAYNTHTMDLATLTSADAGAEWTPSPVVDLTAPLVALLEDDETPVWFSFSAEGEGSSWQVDDVYVDPYGKG
jgi:hypothetical protein